MAGLGILLATLAALWCAIRLVTALSLPTLRRRDQRYPADDGAGPSADAAPHDDGVGHHGWGGGDHIGDGGGHDGH